jgi:hypothetical protein
VRLFALRRKPEVVGRYHPWQGDRW